MKKRADGRYQKRLSLGVKDGKRIYEYVYGRTIKEVNEKATEILSLRSRGVVLSRESVTVEQLCRKWLKSEKEDSVKPQSLYILTHRLDRLCQFMGDIKVRDLTAEHVEAFREQMKAENAPSVFNDVLPMLRSMLNYAVRCDITARNISLGIKPIKYKQKQKRALTAFELLAIRDAELDTWERAFIDILFYTGMRIGEALALRVSDVDFTKKTIRINKTVVSQSGLIQEHTKTDAGMRNVTMPDALIPSLKAWCDIVEKGLLFTNRKNEPYVNSVFHHHWKIIKKKIFGENAPDDFTPHLFRHNYASNLYKAGVDIKTAQYLLGHNDIKTTLDTYTHFSEVDVNPDLINRVFESGSQKVVKRAKKALV